MSERCIVRVKFTPANAQAGKAVGGLFRSVQDRDLHDGQLTRAAMGSLAAETGGELRWIAAIHRNTLHHHVHLVVAGMRQEAGGAYRRADITKLRLEAMKHAVGLEVERQRGERVAVRAPHAANANGAERSRAVHRPIPVSASFIQLLADRCRPKHRSSGPAYASGSLLRLRNVARLYQRQVERETEEEV